MVICNVLDLVDPHTNEEEAKQEYKVLKKVFHAVHRGKVQRQITQSYAHKADKGMVLKGMVLKYNTGVSPREQTDIEHEPWPAILSFCLFLFLTMHMFF